VVQQVHVIGTDLGRKAGIKIKKRQILLPLLGDRFLQYQKEGVVEAKFIVKEKTEQGAQPDERKYLETWRASRGSSGNGKRNKGDFKEETLEKRVR